MIGQSQNSLAETPFLRNFQAGVEGVVWEPKGDRLASEQVQVSVELDKSKTCRQARLRLDRRLLKHPVLGQVCSAVVRDFLDATIPGRNSEYRHSAWYLSLQESQFQCDGLDFQREVAGAWVNLTVTQAQSFFGKWFKR